MEWEKVSQHQSPIFLCKYYWDTKKYMLHWYPSSCSNLKSMVIVHRNKKALFLVFHKYSKYMYKMYVVCYWNEHLVGVSTSFIWKLFAYFDCFHRIYYFHSLSMSFYLILSQIIQLFFKRKYLKLFPSISFDRIIVKIWKLQKYIRIKYTLKGIHMKNWCKL